MFVICFYNVDLCVSSCCMGSMIFLQLHNTLHELFCGYELQFGSYKNSNRIAKQIIQIVGYISPAGGTGELVTSIEICNQNSTNVYFYEFNRCLRIHIEPALNGALNSNIRKICLCSLSKKDSLHSVT